MNKINPWIIGVIIELILVIYLFSLIFLTSNTNLDNPDLPNTDTDYPFSNSTVNLQLGWNIISLPTTSYKYSIYINYNNQSYTWNQAVDNNLIANIVLNYKDNNYTNVDYLYKTKGYWIFTFVNNIYISEDPFTLYCGKIMFNSSYNNITCQKLIIAPELYNNTIYCNTLTALDTYTFYYIGGEVLHG